MTEQPSDTSPASFATPAQRERWACTPEGGEYVCDVLVVGGGLSGVAAAIAAARRGMEVVLLEELHMVGGQATTSGVSAMDITFFYERALHRHGMWGELHARLTRVYDEELSRPVNTARYREDSFAPNVVVLERVLSEMLDDAGVLCLRNATVGTVDHRAALTRVVLGDSRGVVSARLLIDATEDGALLEQAGVGHRVGNAIWRPGKPPTVDLSQVALQDITQVALVRRYPDAVPSELVMDQAPPGWASVRQFVAAAFPRGPQTQDLLHPNGFAGYRAVPDLASSVRYTGSQWTEISRTAINYHNDQRIFADYLADPGARAQYEAAAMAKTLAVLFHLQHERGLSWSVATDEGYAEGKVERHIPPALEPWTAILRHFPPRPYIRESRRLLGVETITGKDMFRTRNHSEARWRPDAVAVGTYPPDLHGGREEKDLEKDLGESLADKPSTWREGPFPIPLGALISLTNDRVIAAEKNISASRIANGATRLHPTVVATGEAAGTLAAIAVRRGVPPRAVPVEAVQWSLATAGVLISPLAIKGLDREHEDFAPVVLAVARGLASAAVDRSAQMEHQLVVDRGAALRRGRWLAEDIRAWHV